MVVRRRWTALIALAMVGVPAASAAAPGAPGAPAIPEARWTAELPDATLRTGSRAPARADVPSAPPRVPAGRVPDAVTAASLYVDVCRDSGGDAFDVRRTALLMNEDRTEVAFTLRTCDPDALADFAGQAISWVTVPTFGAKAGHVYTVQENPAGDLRLYRDGEVVIPATVGLSAEQPAPGVEQLVAIMPASQLDLPATCDPASDVGCIALGIRSFDSGGTLRDEMPDEGAPPPVWPSACRPDIDPSAAGRAKVTTSSPAAARDLAATLRNAGYRAEASTVGASVEVLVGATEAVREALAARPDVADVALVDAPRRLTAVTPDDPQYDRQWYLPRIGMPDAWGDRRASDVGIAVVDNGVAADRPDLEGRVGVGYDAMTGRQLAPGEHSDLGGHGTAVAALAAATGDDAAGMAGVDWGATVHPVRVFDHAGCFVSENAYRDALDWIADNADRHDIRVANFSLGGSPIDGEQERVGRMVDEGVAVVAAMGNNGDTVGATPSFPAALPQVVAVGATGGQDDRLAGYSNGGRHVDVVAPGGRIDGDASSAILTLADPVVVGPSQPFAPLAGTSFSSPLVAGVAALYLGEHAAATPADVARALVSTAEDLGEPGDLGGFDIGYGFGMVDAPRVLDHAPGQTLVRLAGEDRYETAAVTSRRAFPQPDLVDTVLLATGQNYPDALAGGPLAAREHAPILLTPRDALHPAMLDELDRLSPARVLVLGGPAALTAEVVEGLAGRGYDVDRIAGETRYHTAAAIALGDPAAGSWRSWNSADVVYLATGENFPDALPGGAAAASFDAPLLLTARASLPTPTADALRALRPSQVVVLGGPNAVDEVVVDQVQSLTGARVDRAAGETRYETAIAALCPTSRLCQADTRFAVVATGEGFADALGGSAAAAALRAPLVLVPGSGDLPAVVEEAMEIVAPEQMVVLGGPVPIPEEVAVRVRELAVR